MDNGSNNDTITMTVGELRALEETIRTQAKVDELAKFMTNHDGEDRTRFDALFKELRKIDNDVRTFPKTLAECQQELRNETEQKYVSKKEVRAGFLAVSAIQIFIGILIMSTMNGAPIP